MFNCGCYGELSHKNDDYFILGHKHRHFSYGIVLHCNQFMFLFFYFLKAFILKIGIVSRQLFRFYDGTLWHIHCTLTVQLSNNIVLDLDKASNRNYWVAFIELCDFNNYNFTAFYACLCRLHGAWLFIVSMRIFALQHWSSLTKWEYMTKINVAMVALKFKTVFVSLNRFAACSVWHNFFSKWNLIVGRNRAKNNKNSFYW